MSECIFCKIVRGEAPSWRIMENKYALAFLDINPVTKYHTLVIPKKHYVNIFDVSKQDLKAVIYMVRKLSRLYQKKLGINHLQIINSNGAYGQQDVFHIHFHIVPRSAGDGQNIKWNTHAEWRTDFDHMVTQLQKRF